MTVNRVRVRSVWVWPVLAWVLVRIYRQARRAPGNLGIRVFTTCGNDLWTVTAWADEAAMRAFRDTGPHGRAKPKKAIWFDEAAVADWRQDDPTLPTAAKAAAILRAVGRQSHVYFPSAAQTAGVLVPE